MTDLLPARRQADRADLSVPRGTAGLRAGPHYDPDAFGRFSEAVARFMGTGRFLAAQTVIVAGWIVLNATGLVRHWDPFPFILLNLSFSTQAAYVAEWRPIIRPASSGRNIIYGGVARRN